MAFDLIFFKKKDDTTKLTQIIEYFDSLANFESRTYDDINYSFVYFNENNDVYFIINYNLEYNIENPDLNIPDDYEFSYLVFTINYLRPSFFALEAMPLVFEFARKFNLLILDPQLDSLSIKNYQTNDLINSYNNANLNYCKSFNEQVPLKIIPYEKAKYTYEYLNEFKKIQSSLDDLYYVPKMQYLVNTENYQVYTAITWHNASPLVLPKCDYVIILKEVKTLFGLLKKQKTHIIDYETIITNFKDLLQPFASGIKELSILSIENSNLAQEIFNNLPETENEVFESIESDDFIDFEI